MGTVADEEIRGLGAARPRAPAGLRRCRPVRPGNGADLRAHLGLCRARERGRPGPATTCARRIGRREIIVVRGDDGRLAGFRKPLPAPRRDALQPPARPRLDLRLLLSWLVVRARRAAARRAAAARLRGRLRCRRPAPQPRAGGAHRQLPRLRLRQSVRWGAGARGLSRAGARLPRQHGRPRAGRSAGPCRRRVPPDLPRQLEGAYREHLRFHPWRVPAPLVLGHRQGLGARQTDRPTRRTWRSR